MAYPTIRARIIREPMINTFFLTSLPFLIKNNIPSPALTERPAIIDPNVKPPSIYNSVKTIEAAQFGINPTTTAKIGWKAYDDCKNSANLSSPIKNMIVPNTKLIINT